MTTIAITGGARGIGYAIAEAFQAAGAKVAIGDISGAPEAGSRLGVTALPLDVTSRESFSEFLDTAEDMLGPLDVLVNNAGIMPIGPLCEETDADARRCLDINLHGVMLGTKLAVARMRERGAGHVINVASVAGVLPTPGIALYNASKAGVVAFTEAARLECKPYGVHVSAVLPTFTNTELIAGTRSPKGQRNCEPAEIAAAVVGLVRKPRPRVVVPGRLAPNLALLGLLPAGVREWSSRRYGLDRIFLDFDHAARKDYDHRIRD